MVGKEEQGRNMINIPDSVLKPLGEYPDWEKAAFIEAIEFRHKQSGIEITEEMVVKAFNNWVKDRAGMWKTPEKSV